MIEKSNLLTKVWDIPFWAVLLIYAGSACAVISIVFGFYSIIN